MSRLLPLSVSRRLRFSKPGFALQATEVWEWVVKRRILDPFSIFRVDFVPT